MRLRAIDIIMKIIDDIWKLVYDNKCNDGSILNLNIISIDVITETNNRI